MKTPSTARSVAASPLRLRPLTAALLALGVGSVQADVFIITSTGDDGPGSLRQAVADASTLPGPHTIEFDLKDEDSIVLTSGRILIEDTKLTILGPGRDQLSISGNNASRVFDIQGASQVTLRDLTLRDGRADQGDTFVDGAGGAIRVGHIDEDAGLCLDQPDAGPNPDAAHLVLDGVDIVDSQSGPVTAAGLSWGGAAAIGTGSSMNARNSRFRNNLATRSGGAIGSWGGHIDLADVEVSGNAVQAHAGNPAGGAIVTFCGGLDIVRSVIRDNALRGEPDLNPEPVTAFGAGLMINPPGQPVRISHSEISGNTWPGGSMIQGGGIHYADWSIDGLHELHLVNSTVSGNTEIGETPGGYGPGIAVLGTARISNSTITRNGAAAPYGAAVDIYDIGYGASLTTESALIAGSDGYDVSLIANDPTIAGSHNLFGSVIDGTQAPPDTITGVEPLLGPLAGNGGPTRTHALLDGSPAIDAGDNPKNLDFDQRGLGFDRVIGGAADIGAFEAGSDTIFKHDFELPD